MSNSMVIVDITTSSDISSDVGLLSFSHWHGDIKSNKLPRSSIVTSIGEGLSSDHQLGLSVGVAVGVLNDTKVEPEHGVSLGGHDSISCH